MQREMQPSDPVSPARAMVPVWILFALCTGPELWLALADRGIVGPPRARSLAFELGAFWPGLLADWRPNYAAQPWTMFATHAFLHGGPLHLALNMLTLVSLGRAVTDEAGPGGFLLVYGASALGGGAVFALLTTSDAPMVGASGALFGLAGALLAWRWEAAPSLLAAARAVGRIVALFAAINVIMYLGLQGRLAWETHLGGFLAGWIVGIALAPDHGR
jgi:membrane associated rhomboid family serine protease